MSIIDPSGNEITIAAPKVKGATPVGSQVLVEILSSKEILGTDLHIGDVKIGAPQAYILAFGPKTNTEDWGFEVGNRVVLSGNFTPLPEIKNASKRITAVVEPHTIKAVLVEE